MVKLQLYEGKKLIKTEVVNDRNDLLDIVNSRNRSNYYSGKRARWHILR